MNPREPGPDSMTASEYFGRMVESYDSLMRRAVPHYDEMQQRLAEYLPRSAARVLELGCGTGNLTLALAARYPEVELTSVDASPEMIACARQRLEAAHPRSVPRSRFLEARFEDLEPGSRAFDLVVSSISLHHVRAKEPLFRALHSAIAPGGALRFADQFAGATPAIHGVNWNRWLAFCREPGQCTEEEIRSLLDHAAAHDHYQSVRQHFGMLEAAGFRDVDCVWRQGIWGIVTAERA